MSSGGCFEVDRKRLKIEEQESIAGKPTFWDDQQKAQALLRETKQLKTVVGAWDAQVRAISDAEVLLDLAEEAGDADTAREAEASVAAVRKAFEDLEFRRMLSGELDGSDAIVQIQSGAGGVDASDWAQMLTRMILRYCERKGWSVELLDEQLAEEAGIKGCTFVVHGDYAYGLLKAEGGVHRLVRVSPFDAQGRRQTSFASIQVTPDISDDIVVEINEIDLRIDTYRAGGAGGQHVNKTESAIRITHLPSGVVVACQDERSQIQNRERAMRILRAKLLEAERERITNEYSEARRGQVGTGDRSEKIRTYNYPQSRVTDHRIGLSIMNLPAIVEGDLDEIVGALQTAEQEALLQEANQ